VLFLLWFHSATPTLTPLFALAVFGEHLLNFTHNPSSAYLWGKMFKIFCFGLRTVLPFASISR
jgi:hypothetical protein